MRYVLTTPIRERTPEDFHAYVQGLYAATATAPESKAAKGLKLHVKVLGPLEWDIRIRCTREQKIVTQAEVYNLGIEYSLDYDSLYNLFDLRKFKITNDSGEVLNVKTKRTRKRSPTKTKRDAHIEQNTEWANDRPDQLFKSGINTDMST